MEAGGNILDFEQVKRIIPQRFPFMMLDCVVEAEAGVRVVGLKNLSGNEWFYQGHFPDRAVTPGAMLCEAIAQTSIVFLHLIQPRSGDRTYLLGGIKARFLHPVWPGEQLKIEVTPIKVVSNAAILRGNIVVRGRIVAKGELMLSVQPVSQP